jgi:aspartyl-tRNA(Asn)/glutamyl-tRNA(Gln) amidotransferase subunit C
MIDKKEVKHIAKLARLGLSEKEIEKIQKELSPILDYFEQLKKVDVSNIEPTSHSVLLENIMRKDEETSEPGKDRAKLLQLAPETKKDHLKVKPIL